MSRASRASRDPYSRLLRWYPKAWQRAHGEVLRGTLLDAADATGRLTPSWGERRAVALTGLGMRLSARLAMGTALVALVIGAAAAALTLLSAGVWSIWWLDIVIAAVVPGLVCIGIASLARVRGLLTPTRAVHVLVVAVAAVVLAAVTRGSWAQGFDLADAGLAQTGLAALWVPLFLASWAVGGAALALMSDGMLSRTALPSFGRVPLSVLAGILAAPVIGVALISSGTAVVAAAGLATVTLLSRGAARTGSAGSASSAGTPSRAQRAAPSHHQVQSPGRIARLFASLSAAVGAFGVVYAVTGSLWSSGAADSTIAMGQGVGLLLVAALPLLAAVGLLAMAKGRRSVLGIWGPLTLTALALSAVAIAYLRAPDGGAMMPGLVAAAALSGGAVAWWLIGLLRGPALTRVVLALAIGFGFAALFGMVVLPLLAFTVPVLALITAIWGGRVPRDGAIFATEAHLDGVPSTQPG